MPATTTYGVDLILELGVGRQAGAGVWDGATAASRWDTAYWAQTDTALGDWVDVTCDVVAPFALTAGSSDVEGVVTRWEGATCVFTLDGPAWDPWGGPYADLLGPEVAGRWRWKPTSDPPTAWRPLFYGATTDAGWNWDPRTGQADVVLVDSTSDLATFDGVKQDPPIGAGDTGAQRVTRILDVARWPTDRRDITAGGVPMVATNLDAKAWPLLLKVADTDLALMFVDRAGKLVYRPQGRTAVTVLTAALLACPDPRYPDGIQVVDMRRADPTPVTNIVAVRGGTPYQGTDPPYTIVTDEESVARYRAHRSTWDLIHDTATAPAGWSGTVAQLVAASQAWPSPAPHTLTLGLISGDLRVPGVLFGLIPGQAFTVVDTGGRLWVEQVAGWDVEVGWDTCGGQLYVTDVTRWAGSMWDTAGWDIDRWTL